MAINRKVAISKSVASKVTNCDLKQQRDEDVEAVQQQIVVVRGHRVMMDHDLARPYGVSTKQLNQQLKRNRNRFPADFAFRLTLAEANQIAALRSQNCDLKARPPYQARATCIHRAWRDHVSQCSEEQGSPPGQHLCRARIRQNARGACAICGISRRMPIGFITAGRVRRKKEQA